MITDGGAEAFTVCRLVGRRGRCMGSAHRAGNEAGAAMMGKGGMNLYVLALPDRRRAWNFQKS